jgi:predicted nucleic acid-binding protein
VATLVSAISPPVTVVGALYTVHRGQQNALTLCLADGIDVLLIDDIGGAMAAKS